jgi:alpha-galactosidase
VEIWRNDLEIPTKFGVDTNIGDTRGPSGIFRALRTIPVMLDICRDIERLCPDAILLNYTNPMAMLCRAMQRETRVKVTGLCHSVQGTAQMLARWIGAPMEEVDYTCAGINHMAFYLKFCWKGKDAYPLLRQAVERPEVYKEEIVRNEMFKALDYYVTESSGHNSEYNWWFRKRKELIEKYCAPGTGWNPGESMAGLKWRLKQQHNWQQEVEKWFTNPDTLKLQRGEEYAAYIINAVLGGEPFEFNGNVPNTGLITNLPQEACVEVPVLANRRGFSPMHVGAMPPQLAALVGLTVAVEEMAVEAALTGNARLVYQAICLDPLSAAVLSLEEIKEMTRQLFAASAPCLPQFKHVEI